MKRLFLIMIIIALIASLSGCITPDVEMPANEGDAADEMRKSPCACAELKNYNGGGFTWVS